MYASVHQVFHVDAQRSGDLVQGDGAGVGLAALQLRDSGTGDSGAPGQVPRGHLAELAIDADGVLAAAEALCIAPGDQLDAGLLAATPLAMFPLLRDPE